MVEKSVEVKELWGTRFDVVQNGLSEEQVVSFVTDLMAEAQKAREGQERQSSLLKLAEQTVLEAERMAAEIKDRGYQVQILYVGDGAPSIDVPGIRIVRVGRALEDLGEHEPVLAN